MGARNGAEGVSMLMWRLVALSAFCVAIAGCEEPPRIVPAAPPGTEAKPPMPPSEKDPAQALGEVREASKTAAKATPPPAPSIALALPTAKGETKTTASGVKYETLKAGDGAEAKPGQTVQVHYTGTLENGTEFDSSRRPDRTPFSFRIGAGGVIRGWDEGVPGMKVGETRKLIVPASAAYGDQDKGSIPPNSTLIFEVELLKVE